MANTGVVYARPQIGPEAATLGVSGKLWRDSLIMYDRATRSLWSQLNGRAVAGPLKGKRLAHLPSELTTWSDWKRRHPDTLVLIKPRQSGSGYADYHRDPAKIGVLGTANPDPRLPAKTLVLGIEHKDRYAAIPIGLITSRRATNLDILGTPMTILTSGHGAAARVHLRNPDGSAGSAVRAFPVYWGVWAQFHPDTEVIQPKSLD